MEKLLCESQRRQTCRSCDLQGSLGKHMANADVFSTQHSSPDIWYGKPDAINMPDPLCTQHDCMLNNTRLVDVRYLEEQTWVETLDGSPAAVPLAQMNLTIATTAKKLD